MTDGIADPDATATPRRLGAAAWAPVALLTVAPIAALYLLLPAANYTDAKDSLSYALRIRNGDPLFHPNHLLYEPVNYVIHRTVEAIGGPVDPLRTMQLFSTVCAVPLVLLAWLLTWRARGDAWAAAIAAGAVGFSFGVWCYAVSPDGYTPPLFLVLLSIALLDPVAWRRSRGGSEGAPVVLVIIAALATAAAVLLHQMYVFFAIATGLLILARPEFGRPAARVRSFLWYGGLSGAITIIAYLAAYAAVAKDPVFLDWARGYARSGFYYGDPPSITTPIRGAAGAVSAMLTMNGLLAVDAIADALIRAFPRQSLFEERFIALTSIPRPMAVAILLAMIAAVALWCVLALRAIATRIRPERPGGFVDALLLTSVALYTALVMIWEPVNREFWIQTYVLMTIWCLRQPILADRRGKSVAVALVGVLFFVNYFGAMRPAARVETDYWRVVNRAAIERADSTDLVITSCSWLCGRYLDYFAHATVVSPGDEDLEGLRARIAAVGPDRVLVSSWAYRPHPAYRDIRSRPARARTAAFAAAFPEPAGADVEGSAQRFYALGADGLPVVLSASETPPSSALLRAERLAPEVTEGLGGPAGE